MYEIEEGNEEKDIGGGGSVMLLEPTDLLVSVVHSVKKGERKVFYPAL